MTTFQKYSSIENSYREKYLEKIRAHDYDHDDREYVVQEKVHGANLSFHMSHGDTNILTARRTGFLVEDENFYGYQRVREQLRKPLLDVFAKVDCCIPNVTTVAVYGEIFGGMYDHRDVDRVMAVSKVQKGIHYHPDVRFYAFDILVNNETYLNVDLANDFFEEVGLFYARTLFRGSLKDALSFPNEFDSNIGTWLGLPAIEGNTCEGVVIRPVETLYFRGQQKNSRVMLKNKNTKWGENQSVQKRQQIVKELGSDAKGLQEVLKGYLTTNRVQNVMSKMSGQWEKQEGCSKKDMAQIMREFMPDALEDFEKDYGEYWSALKKKDRKEAIKGLNKYAFNQVRTAVSGSR